MKSWKTLLGLGLGWALVAGCTISTGDGDDDDDRDRDSGSVTGPGPANGDEDSGTQTPAPPSPPSEVDSGKTPDPGPAGDPDFMCDLADDDACEACMAKFCCEDRAACAASGTCMTEWAAIKSCMDDKDLMSNPSDDNQKEVEDCLTQAAPNENSIELSDEVFNLTSCVGKDYVEMMGADGGVSDAGNSGLVPGDDLCTLACYGVFSTNPPDTNPDENQ